MRSFTLLGFMGVYALLSLLFCFVAYRILDDGPEKAAATLTEESA